MLKSLACFFSRGLNKGGWTPFDLVSLGSGHAAEVAWPSPVVVGILAPTTLKNMD